MRTRLAENICKGRPAEGLLQNTDKGILTLNNKETDNLTKQYAKDVNTSPKTTCR